MEPRILVINQDKDTEDRDRQMVNSLIEAYMYHGGHDFRVVKSVRDITSQEYGEWDCVLAHVPAKELQQLEQLALENPRTGLILTTGDSLGTDCQKLFRDEHANIFFLPKPFTHQTFENAVKRVVFEARS
jgi:DNA-binding NtrC family response regulator